VLPELLDTGISSTATKPILAITESHTDTITNLIFHAPVPPNSPVGGTTSADDKVHLITSSTDGLISVIDPTVYEEEDAVLTTLNNRSAVQHLRDFVGSNRNLLTSGHLCAISQDERFSVHAVAEGDPESETSDPTAFDLKEELKCDYTIALKEQQGGETCVLAVGAFKPSVFLFYHSLPHFLCTKL